MRSLRQSHPRVTGLEVMVTDPEAPMKDKPEACPAQPMASIHFNSNGLPIFKFNPQKGPHELLKVPRPDIEV